MRQMLERKRSTAEHTSGVERKDLSNRGSFIILTKQRRGVCEGDLRRFPEDRDRFDEQESRKDEGFVRRSEQGPFKRQVRDQSRDIPERGKGGICAALRKGKLEAARLEGNQYSPFCDIPDSKTWNCRHSDLSYNKELGGQLTPATGNLMQLESLSAFPVKLHRILVRCSFSGSIPKELGKLTKLIYLGLNSNQFIGTIPASLGSLSNLVRLDLGDNQLTGPLPISNGSAPGLDQLKNAQHFHLNKNRLSGSIPEQLFHSDMRLRHLILDRNQFVGTIPASIVTATKLEIIRLDKNQLEGIVPNNINNLAKLAVLNLANNGLDGPMPNLTGMNFLSNVDLSNNSFEPSEAPAWISELQNLTNLFFFFFYRILKNNSFNGTLDMGSNISNQLHVVNFENNALTLVVLGSSYNNSMLLSGNPLCSNIHLLETNYCLPPQQSLPTYSSGIRNCNGSSCATNNTCSHPYEAIIFFRAPYFQDITNDTAFLLEQRLWMKYGSYVGSISLKNPFFNNDTYLEVQVAICPLIRTYFSIRDILEYLEFNSNNFSASPNFGPSDFEAYPYLFQVNNQFIYSLQILKCYLIASLGVQSFAESSGLNLSFIIGLAVLSALLLLGFSGLSFYAIKQKKRAKKVIELNNPFASWEASFKNDGEAPQVNGAKSYSFEELKRCTNNFPEVNVIGLGGYGKVYRGMLPNGRMVAIKRSMAESTQGALEFKTEIELLSRVHHKNLVELLGFCFQRGERMLVYEYVPKKTLRESLSGESGIQLDWIRRLRIALDSARGIAYLHDLANPPIIHRDIKSTNILLDENLNAKVADFGLSKLVSNSEVGQVSTNVKGTLGYLDPEYYMTHILTDKSDVYSFGVLILELITGNPPIQNGKYIVSIVKSKLNKNDVYYGLKELVDPVIRQATYIVGFRRIVELALKCVEESAADRPAMSDVVKEIEMILKKEGFESVLRSTSTNDAELAAAMAGSVILYDENLSHKEISGSSFAYSGSYTLPMKLEPK
ncbi:LOW QUALITY PROTEIN: probable leucine-rich repeat receptor-like protein kinase At5g49770 [Phalaenopsis equestris]|uniref:LOW QUALITY PROTEIN: probable leucine-rich repeat receptor-like protein kinase At5g49770 n=1 Tax=Phalaenopsis equestris TaxID=78828 RepID=UPI0009E64DE9|nr:LOW QUALITY PROTEIN: probable leucine-rich repeat receptor-like protein kinase At5g49770 [Phalaenopsis equestris]